MEVATGTYFKVVDSDDWFDVPSYKTAISTLKELGSIDLLVTNYVYEYYYNGKQKTVRYRNVFPEDEVFTWDKMRFFRVSQMMLMHSMIYRTSLLRECGLKLPEHTFYVDNIFAYQPLPYVKSIYYLDCDLYRYFIGRPDQSVNTDIMIKRIDQQLRVTRIMFNAYDVLNDIKCKKLRKYMIHCLSMMVAISIVHINLSDDESLQRKANDLWNFVRQRDERLYVIIHRSFINSCIRFTYKSGKKATQRGFKLVKHIYKFS